MTSEGDPPQARGDGARDRTLPGKGASRLVIEHEDLETGELGDRLPPVGEPAPHVEVSLKKSAAPPPIVPASAKTPLVQSELSAPVAPAPTPAQIAAERPAASAPQAPAGGWIGRNASKIVIGSGALVALAVGFVVAFLVLDVFNSDAERVSDALASTSSVFDEPTEAVRQARSRRSDRLPAVRAAGTDAARRADEIAAEADDLRGDVTDGAIANPALELMAAEERFLRELARVGELDERSLRDWAGIQPGLQRARADIVAAGRRVAALDLGTSEVAVPEAVDVDEAVAAVDEVVRDADRALRRWQRDRREALAARRQVTAYRGGMAALIEEYFEQRDVTRTFTQQPGTSYGEARETLTAHARARQAIIDRMAALAPPAEVRLAHNQMVELCRQSRELLVSAAEDTVFDEFDPSTPVDWPGSPGYERLLSASDSITNQFAPRKQAVLGAADGVIARARIPRKPRV